MTEVNSNTGKTCSVEGCDRSGPLTRSMCAMHYLRWRRHGDAGPAERTVNLEWTACSVDGCERHGIRFGFCSKHAYRFKRYGDPLYTKNDTYGEPQNWLIEFCKSHEHTDDCIEWPFQKCKLVYGRLRLHSGNGKQAHREILKIVAGNPPDESYQAAHGCNNRSCVNPRHLRWATRIENQHDRRDHGTSGRKLSKEQAIAIYSDDREPKHIAEQYKISPSTISEIKSGRTWAWATQHDDGKQRCLI